MNIFYLSFDVDECAQQMVDKHVVKMILEYCQLLSTAHRVLDGVKVQELSKNGRRVTRYKLEGSPKCYEATHVMHPSAVWVRKSDCNYVWLFTMLEALLKEYTHRYSRVHKCSELIPFLRNIPMHIPIDRFTDPTPAMPDEFKVPGDSIASYRRYYLGKKSGMFSWTKRSAPLWCKV